MYTWAKVNTVQRAVVIISALGAQYGDNQTSRPQERAEGLAEPIDISLSGRRVCRTHEGTTGASLYYQSPSSGWIPLHFWQSFSYHLRCSPLVVQSRSLGGRLQRLNSLQLLTQPRTHKNACGLWCTDVRSVPCQPDLGVGAKSEATPDTPFTGHSILAGRTAESIKL